MDLKVRSAVNMSGLKCRHRIGTTMGFVVAASLPILQPLLFCTNTTTPPKTTSNKRPIALSYYNSCGGYGYGHGLRVRIVAPQRLSVVCMANPKRVQMVAKQIQREIAEMLQKDKILLKAILPETALGADTFLSSLTTISDVEVSKDLQFVKVYVSVCGDDRGREIAMKGLKARQKYVRAQLGKRIRLRLTPHVYFIEDESIAKGNRVAAILESIKQERERKQLEYEPETNDSEDDNQIGEDGEIPENEEDWASDEDELIYIK